MPLCVPVLHAPTSSAAYSRYVQRVYTKGLSAAFGAAYVGLCDLMHVCVCLLSCNKRRAMMAFNRKFA